MHCEHDEEAARRCCWEMEDCEVGDDVEAAVVVEVGLAGRGEGGGAWLGPRGIMVLFLKQVHLQKVGAAEGR